MIIILMLTYITAAFDVLDISDLSLGGKNIFTSEDASANQIDDNLDNSYNYSYSSIALNQFFLPASAIVFDFVADTNEFFDRTTLHISTSPLKSLYRPPIA